MDAQIQAAEGDERRQQQRKASDPAAKDAAKQRRRRKGRHGVPRREGAVAGLGDEHVDFVAALKGAAAAEQGLHQQVADQRTEGDAENQQQALLPPLPEQRNGPQNPHGAQVAQMGHRAQQLVQPRMAQPLLQSIQQVVVQLIETLNHVHSFCLLRCLFIRHFQSRSCRPSGSAMPRRKCQRPFSRRRAQKSRRFVSSQDGQRSRLYQ